MDNTDIKNMDVLSYIVDFSDSKITKKDREALINANLSAYEQSQLLNDMLLIVSEKLTNNDIEFNTATELIKSEYQALKLDTFVAYSVIENLISLYLNKFKYGLEFTRDEQIINLKQIIEVANSADIPVKNDIYVAILRYINRMNLVACDINFTKKVLKYCKSIKEEERFITYLPNELINL